MRFDFSRRPAEFGGFNNRWENIGSGGEKRKAVDLPMRFAVKIGKELDMVVPVGVPKGTKFSVFLFGPNARKPQLSTHVLSPLKVHRKPEHIKVSIYDNELDKRKVMTFDDVNVKDPTLEWDEDGVYLSCKLQIRPTFEQFARIAEKVEIKTREFECYATAPELLDQKEEEEEGEDGGQEDIEGEEGEGSEED